MINGGPPAKSGHSPRRRTRRPLDLAGPGVLESVGKDQIAYYRARASWYDDVYQCVGEYDRGRVLNDRWLGDLAEVRRALSAASLHGQCVELGAGTGYWTELVVDCVERVWALDAAPEVVEIARARLGGRAAKVQFETVNLWRWQPSQVWDSAAAFFFLEHVPDEILPGLLTRLHDALRPNSPFFVAEGGAQDVAPAIEGRSIDKRTFDVVERRRSTKEFESALGAAGFSVRSATDGRLLHLVAIRE
jgi:SAM-dependent methyltransferase